MKKLLFYILTILSLSFSNAYSSSVFGNLKISMIIESCTKVTLWNGQIVKPVNGIYELYSDLNSTYTIYFCYGAKKIDDGFGNLGYLALTRVYGSYSPPFPDGGAIEYDYIFNGFGSSEQLSYGEYGQTYANFDPPYYKILIPGYRTTYSNVRIPYVGMHLVFSGGIATIKIFIESFK